MQFRQSVTDSPLTVRLGEKTPAWGLTRWAGNGGLRFIPPDDEGFTLRGDKRQLVFKGRRRSHRFTILGDGAFEYDCILNKEPESNIVSLRMEGAESFDFFRQPDFVPDPFLKGSYAVYKKETLIGEGTGKLCHIHRPEIIDARGRRCWGELSIVEDSLCITIPKNWLSEAAYPVIVDPTVGTTTVGSQTKWVTIASNGIEHYCLLGALIVNRFLFPESYDGNVTAYLYVYDKVSMSGCRPVLYSDNNNIPLNKLSSNEGNIDVSVSGTNAAGWRSASFNINTNIQSGSYIWYGISAALFYPRFDYGAKLYWYSYDNYAANLPNAFPLFPDGRFYDYKVSMYFDYATAQNYERTLTQGVTLIDSRKLTAEYKRSSLQTAKGITVLNSSVSFFRQCLMNVTNSMNLSRAPIFIRSAVEQARITGGLNNSRGLNRKYEETAAVNDEARRSLGIYRGVNDSLAIGDNAFFPVIFVRSISETQGITDTFRQWGEYIRGLYVEAGTMAVTTHRGEYFRTESDTVQADVAVFRGLLIFIRILTTSFVRDYFLRRFLKARDELVLKSPICLEITLESRID